MTDRLLDVDVVAKRTGTTKALVPLSHDACALCGAVLLTIEATQAALFRHGGYGETKRGTVHVCAACGWVGNTRQESTNPRHS